MGWGVGLFFHVIVRKERARNVLAPVVLALAVGAGSAASVTESMSVEHRASRFPVVAVREIALAKRNVLECGPLGRIEVLAFDDFDAQPGKDIVVLGAYGLAVLDPANYAVKSNAPFEHEACEHCVHMYRQAPS
jgi:hypothetical protein